MAQNMQLLTELPNTSRVGRYPKHTFAVRSLPFTAQPFMIAPVLPGETLNSLFMESRVITDPVRNPIIGWKKEYYFFYVKVTDLLNDAIRDMFIDPTNTDLRATLGVAANSQYFYTAKGGVDYTSRAMTRIIDEYFRDAGEVTADFVTAAGVPIVQIRESSFLDSLTDKDDMSDGAAISGATDAGDLERLMLAFEQLRALGLSNMSYEDFLRSYGITVPERDEGKPELLARFSDFSYPANVVNPSDGSAKSAVSWVMKGSERSPKFFKEPGFIVGVSITRPKVYFSGLAGSAAAHLTRAWDWLPNYMDQYPETALKFFDVSTAFGPLGDRTTDVDQYWLDMRDLFLYGDQFQNHTAFNVVPADNGDWNMVALPSGTAPLRWKYPSETQCKSFFTDNAGTAYWVKEDGYCSLGIKGRQHDHTVSRVAAQ